MTLEFTPIDQEQRTRIACSLGETLFVEAGAGTGKTTALVGRIVNLLAEGRAAIGNIAAITFTEAAAAELRERTRRALEKEAQNPERAEPARQRCLTALGGLEDGSIQTLHSFAAALLRERPLEAGLPPAFDTVEAIEADINFAERWQQWVGEYLDSATARPCLAKALILGLTLDDLRHVAEEFHDNYDLLAQPFASLPDPSYAAAPEVAKAVAEIRRLLPLSRLGVPGDALAAHATQVALLGERLTLLGAETAAALALLARWGKLTTNKGRQADWERDPASKENGAKLLKDLLASREAQRVAEVAAHRRAALLPILEDLRRFALVYAEERRRAGRAEFHDLLIWARNLLRDHAEAREHFRRRYSHLLIDEFQDTDPIQAEIAFYLAGQSGSPPESGTGPLDWKALTPVPGKLFVVGDPKQSIYRFRRADIAALEEVRARLGGASVPLTQNFRSQEPALDWVNALFAPWMGHDGAGGIQASYVPLTARWQPPASAPPLGVHHFGEALDCSADEARRAEAGTVARLLRQIKAQGWQVRGEGGALRAARYQDICLLLPTRAGLRQLEQALDGEGVPFRIESQSVALNTQDVRELLNCLRAIDDPADPVALVAALRSSAFACSDVELLQFVEAGGQFDYLAPGEVSDPVAEALATLRRYHQARLWEPPDHLAERFIRECGMAELAFTRTRPRERLRRLRLVVERARAFARVEGNSLRAFLDWLEQQAQEQARLVEVPAPEPDEDAVRIMTIHAAKGLEFPIVLLAGLGANPVTRSRPALFDRTASRVEVRLKHSDDLIFATAGYEESNRREQLAEAAEDIRVMYVAATRARDHLLVGLFHSQRNSRSVAAELWRRAATLAPFWQKVAATDSPTNGDLSAHATVNSPVDPETDRTAWLARRAEALRRAVQPASLAVTTLARVAKAEAEQEDEAPRRGRGGSRLGRAVHSVLQNVDLATGEGIEELSRAYAAAEAPQRWEEVANLARRGLASPVVRRAIASGRYYREVFVSSPFHDRRLEGFIDLLFETPQGLVVADYKTDALDAEEVGQGLEQYRLQVGAYALAVSRATKLPVREVVLVFLRAGRELVFSDVASLMDEASRLAVALLDAPAQ